MARRVPAGTPWRAPSVDLPYGQSGLILVLAFFVGITSFTNFFAPHENDLRDSFIGVDLRRQRSRVRYLDRDLALPLRLQRRHVHDDPAAGVRRFAHADRQHVAGYFKILHRLAQGEAVGRYDNETFFARVDVHETSG